MRQQSWRQEKPFRATRQLITKDHVRVLPFLCHYSKKTNSNMLSCTVSTSSSNSMWVCRVHVYAFLMYLLFRSDDTLSLVRCSPWHSIDIFSLENRRPRKHKHWLARRAFCTDVEMGASPHQISVIFLRLTRLSTSQRYELIKGVFHTATTRTSVLISPVPNMQSQGGQGEDCYIWWFVVFFSDKECGIWVEKPICEGTAWATAEAGLDLLDFFPYVFM